MTRDPPLLQVLARDQGAASNPGSSAWADGEQGQAFPSLNLRLLESHQRVATRPVLDRWAQRLRAGFGPWLRPYNRLSRLAAQAQAQAATWSSLSEADFAQQVVFAAGQCRQRRVTRFGGSLSPSDLQALSLVAEAVRRVHGFSPHRVQLTGALALLEGRMAEMATGEGKTLTAAMASVVAAWHGLPCHVVTANDYLAARDAQIGQPLFALCQVSAASVTGETLPAARAAAYRHDIVYTTAKDLLADHLRDGLALGHGTYRTRFALAAARRGGQVAIDGVVMRGVYQVIVDEADSVLIDEAVTPLIISSQHPDHLLEKAAHEAVTLARSLREGEDFRIQRALRHVDWLPRGRELLQQLAQDMPPFWKRADRAEELVQMALYAIHLMVRDQHYVIEQEKVVLVDELTGRLARQRTLSLGMQQVLEASLGLPISAPTRVSARSSFQRFFRLFDRLGGMTGTAREAGAEFAKVYGLSLVSIPTHRPVRRAVWSAHVTLSQEEKFEAIAHECQRLVDMGRSVLIGVRSVAASLALERSLRQQGGRWTLQVLHALNHELESAIVAGAGQPGVVTIATNMAGRGTDISLADSVRASGGLHVIVAQVNDYGRIDRQLLGRCARQGDPGSVRYFISLDEELFRRFLPSLSLRFCRLVFATLPLARSALAWAMIAWAQRTASRLSFRQRANILEQETETEREGF
jgi:preprotein translocase subunit SecA